MSERIHEKDLQAYADGELNAAARRTVEAYLASHPDAAERVRAYCLLSRAARRAIKLDTPLPSQDLRARIDASFDEAFDGAAQPGIDRPEEPVRETMAPASLPAPSALNVPRRRTLVRPWIVAAAAAVLIVTALAAWFATEPDLGDTGHPGWQASSDPPAEPFDGTLSPMLVSDVTAVHVKCARLVDHFIAPEFGETLAELPSPAAQHLGVSAIIPDLGAMGYEYNGAGPCNILGGRTLHVLYRDRNDPGRNISVFVQPDTGMLRIEPDTLHTAAGPDAEYPILVWRGDGRVYYIVADDFDTATTTAGVMGFAAGTRL